MQTRKDPFESLFHPPISPTRAVPRARASESPEPLNLPRAFPASQPNEDDARRPRVHRRPSLVETARNHRGTKRINVFVRLRSQSTLAIDVVDVVALPISPALGSNAPGSSARRGSRASLRHARRSRATPRSINAYIVHAFVRSFSPLESSRSFVP